MGMFDYIAVSDKLPVNQEMIDAGLDKNDHDFQTKCLGKSMSTYIIQGGRLLIERYKTEEWVEDKSKFAGGYMKREDPFISDMNYHGKINFYHFQPTDGYDYWIEYEATFTHGKVENIELIKFKKTDNTEKRKQLEALFASAKAAQEKWYNKYFFHTSPWLMTRDGINRSLYWLERQSEKIRLRLP